MTIEARDPDLPRAPDVVDELRRAILASEFVPNQRLVEADLTERFDVSRATARLALITLENEGLVERTPNRGARVRAISVNEAIEIVEVRIGLEVLCARLAADRLTAEDADELGTLRAAIIRAVKEGRLTDYARLNREMDRVIRVISGHRTATQLLERLLAQSTRHQFRLAFLPGRATVSVVEHVGIIDAVLSRDADAAEAATRSHLAGIADVLRGLE